MADLGDLVPSALALVCSATLSPRSGSFSMAPAPNQPNLIGSSVWSSTYSQITQPLGASDSAELIFCLDAEPFARVALSCTCRTVPLHDRMTSYPNASVFDRATSTKRLVRQAWEQSSDRKMYSTYSSRIEEKRACFSFGSKATPKHCPWRRSHLGCPLRQAAFRYAPCPRGSSGSNSRVSPQDNQRSPARRGSASP